MPKLSAPDQLETRVEPSFNGNFKQVCQYSEELFFFLRIIIVLKPSVTDMILKTKYNQNSGYQEVELHSPIKSVLANSILREGIFKVFCLPALSRAREQEHLVLGECDEKVSQRLGRKMSKKTPS